MVKLLYRQAGGRVRDYSVPRQKPDGEESIYIHQLLEEEQDKVKERKQERRQKEYDEVKGIKRERYLVHLKRREGQPL